MLLFCDFHSIVIYENGGCFMKNDVDKVYCYKYSSNIEDLFLKLNARYYREYIIDYHNETSFAIGVERLGHSSGRWYEATIEKKDSTYLIKGKFVVLPKSEHKKTSLLENIELVLLSVLLFPLIIIIGIGMLFSWIIKKIRKNPFATYDPEKRLDYFMINYLGCTKMDD